MALGRSRGRFETVGYPQASKEVFASPRAAPPSRSKQPTGSKHQRRVSDIGLSRQENSGDLRDKQNMERVASTLPTSIYKV
jgi:hypothetical protein